MKKFILSAALFLTLPTYAATCNSYQSDKAAYYAEIMGREVVRSYQGGDDISTNVTNCDYNSYTNKYKVGIDVYWKGVITGNSYNSSGTMTMNYDGSRRDYAETYRNQNLKDYAWNRAALMIAGGVVAAGTATSSNSSSSGSNSFKIWVKNKCSHTVRLLVRYKNTSGNWKTIGWWRFAPNQSSYLSNDDIYLTTRTSILYYATIPNVSYGSETITYDGSSYSATRLSDDNGDSEIVLCR